MLLAVIFANMRKFIYKALVLTLFISFTAEIGTPLIRDYNTFSFSTSTQDSDEKNDNEKKEEEMKDKNSSNINFLPPKEMITDFYLKNDLANTLGFLSLPEMPPDHV